MKLSYPKPWRRLAGAAAFGCAIAGGTLWAASTLAGTPGAATRSGFLHVGHDNVVVDPTVRRYTGMVAALGKPDAQGKVYSFKTSAVGPRSFPLSRDDLRGWRMTVLAGKRFGEVFTVSTNTDSEISVTSDKGPIDGLAVSDVFIIESIDANGVSMFGAVPAAAAPAPGV